MQIKIGEFLDGGNLDWGLFTEGNRKLVLVGDDEKTKRIFLNIKKQIIALEGVVFFDIGGYKVDKLEDEGTLSIITNFEKHPVDSIPNTMLSKQRKDFVDMYVRMLTEYIGLDRKDLKVSYRPTLEGPLYGYIRASDNLDGDIKEKFDQQLNQLDNVIWENEGDLFIHRVGEEEEGGGLTKLIEFLKGVWSYWVFLMDAPDIADVPKVLHIEVPDTSTYEEVHLKYVERLIQILEDITSISNTTLVVTTDRVSPIINSSIRYKIIGKNSGKDFDFSDTPIGFDDNGDNFAIIDDAESNKIIGRITD